MSAKQRDFSRADALLSVLIRDQEEREAWHRLSESGATDEDLAALLQHRLGTRGRQSSKYAPCRIAAIPRLAFWLNAQGTGEPEIAGSDLLAEIRSVLQIAKNGASTSSPMVTSEHQLTGDESSGTETSNGIAGDSSSKALIRNARAQENRTELTQGAFSTENPQDAESASEASADGAQAQPQQREPRTHRLPTQPDLPGADGPRVGTDENGEQQQLSESIKTQATLVVDAITSRVSASNTERDSKEQMLALMQHEGLMSVPLPNGGTLVRQLKQAEEKIKYVSPKPPKKDPDDSTDDDESDDE